MVTEMLDLLSAETRDSLERWHEIFENATPFKHLIIDNFFREEIAEGLLREFPAFDPERARNEFGKVGGKATTPGIRVLGETYARVDDLLQSRTFLDWMSGLTGIAELQYDPDYFGGGTHENLEGQELDPHVDFNRHHTKKGTYRRLNFIVYLNKDWSEDWGGGIEVHSNPRDPATNEIKSYAPLFNRAILFETHEYSWHGFRRISLPSEKANESRKSLSVYMYTEKPPAAGAAPAHATFYVQRPLLDVVKPGDVLDESRFREVEKLIRKRDDFINFYQRLEMRQNETIDRLEEQIKQWALCTHVPVTGPVYLLRGTVGFEPDGWMLPRGSLRFRAQEAISSVTVSGWVPGDLGEVSVHASVGSYSATATVSSGSSFEVTVPLELAAGNVADLAIEISPPYVPSKETASPDERELGCTNVHAVFR